MRYWTRAAFRAVLTAFAIAAAVVLTQDIQIHPAILAGLFEDTKRSADELPEGIHGTFIETSDSELLEVWYYESGTSGGEKPLAVLFHGNGETVEVNYLGQKLFAEIGIDTLSFDYRGYGRSSGWPSDKGLKNDVAAVIDHAVQFHRADQRPLLMVGASLGSGLAAYAATLIETDVLILSSAYRSIRKVAEERPVISFLSRFVWYDIDTESYLAQLADTCLIMVHAEFDPIIPFAHGEFLYENAIHMRARFRSFPSTRGHFGIPTATHPFVQSSIEKCLAR